MKKLLQLLAILILAIIGVSLLFGGKPLQLLDHIGLWCVTLVGYIVAKIK